MFRVCFTYFEMYHFSGRDVNFQGYPKDTLSPGRSTLDTLMVIPGMSTSRGLFSQPAAEQVATLLSPPHVVPGRSLYIIYIRMSVYM